MLLAFVAPETPPAAIANTSAARATKPTAMNFRLLIDQPSMLLPAYRWSRPRRVASARRIGSYHSPFGAEAFTHRPVCQDQLSHSTTGRPFQAIGPAGMVLTTALSQALNPSSYNAIGTPRRGVGWTLSSVTSL